MARPTKYNPAMQKRADEYLGDYKHDGDVIPSVEGLAAYLGVARRTLYYWSDANESFLHTLEAIEEAQKRITLNNGLTGKFNSVISKLVLANHGMHDKQDNIHTGPGGGPIQNEWVMNPVAPRGED